MKVALIGSTGRAGGWVLEECLSRGYDVTALVRKASKLDAYQDRISSRRRCNQSKRFTTSHLL